MIIVWFALFVSQLIFVFLLFFVKPELFAMDFTKPVLDENAPPLFALAAVSVSTFVISLVLKKRYLRQSVERQSVATVQTAMIVGCALAESISLFGLLSAFAFDFQYFFLFFALGIITALLHFPRRDAVHAASFKS